MIDYTHPDLKNSALLTIDTQRDFTLPGAPAEIPGTYELLPAMRRITGVYRRHGLPIIHVVRLYLADGSNADLCRKRTLERGSQIVCAGTEGAELMDDLKPSPDIRLDPELLLAGRLQELGTQEWMMYKPRWGAFYNTPLEAHLRDVRVDSLTIIGCNFPNCPRTTIFEASERDFRVLVVEDAVSGLYERAKQELENIGVHLIDTRGFLNSLADSDLKIPA